MICGTPIGGRSITPTATATPTPTTEAQVQPEWTLELEIVPTPRNVAGLGNLLLGVNQRCPGAIGCRGSLPPAVVPFDFQVYLCHPPDQSQFNCNGLSSDLLLSKSLLAPAEIQTWVVEVTRTGQVNEITFTWHTSNLPDPDAFPLWIVDSEGIINMQNPPSVPTGPPRSYDVFSLSPDATKREFLICSQVTGVAPDIRCPVKLP